MWSPPSCAYGSLGIIAPLGSDPHGLFALHITGNPLREGETIQEFKERSQAKQIDVPKRPLRAYPRESSESIREPHACPDVLAEPEWYEHEFHLAAGGVRAYASLPLFARPGVCGWATFCRAEPAPFTKDELSILQDVCRPLGVAVANALANEEIRGLRERLEAENTALRAALGQAPWAEEIVGNSAALRRALEAVEQVAATDATVLITGETGTGKELIARAIHRCSPRAQGPLVKVNCAAIPDTLLASELFGHERGAFTGAVERRTGRFEQAHGGTLFLDEIGELPPETQVMLLRVLQEREFERLGGSRTVQVDVRIIAATNRDLDAEVRAGRLRSDLYYRLNVFPVHIAPLRERTEDIPPLVAHLADKYARRFGRKIATIDQRSLETLFAREWPGNVRELENAVERAVILSKNGLLSFDGLAATPAGPQRVVEAMNGDERRNIEAALAASRGRISGERGAAKRLEMPASTLEFRIRKLGIDKFRYKRAG